VNHSTMYKLLKKRQGLAKKADDIREVSSRASVSLSDAAVYYASSRTKQVCSLYTVVQIVDERDDVLWNILISSSSRTTAIRRRDTLGYTL
jgi:hypothetical protein